MEDSNFDFRYVRLCNLDIPREKCLNYLQTMETLIRHHILHLGLHCLPVTLLGVSRLQWVKENLKVSSPSMEFLHMNLSTYIKVLIVLIMGKPSA